MSERVVVFLDWQNVYMRARESFHSRSDDFVCGQVNPLDLAMELAGRGRDTERELTEVRVYRGVPDQAFDTKGYSAARRQMAKWASNRKVTLLARTLRYPPGWPECDEAPREKGVDVALAVDFVTMAADGAYDTGIVMSSDQDLTPAVEYVERTHRVHNARVEVAAWRGPNGRRPNRITTSSNRVYCHWLDQTCYWGLQDQTDYTQAPDRPSGPVPGPRRAF